MKHNILNLNQEKIENYQVFVNGEKYVKESSPKFSNFPKDKVIVCNEKHTVEQAQEIFKLCYEYGVEISVNTFMNPVSNPYPYFGTSQIITGICQYNDLALSNHKAVSFEQFKAFIRGEGKIEEDVKLEVGKWYWKGNILFNYQKGNECYGFEKDGSWSKVKLWCWPKEYPVDGLANESEVKEALTKEAVKRYDNKYIEPLNRHLFDGRYKDANCIHLFDKNSLSITGNQIWMNYGNEYQAIIFQDGKWAEIIPPITRSEAEQKLNCKII